MANQIQRMRYFNGLFLKEDEFNLEQNYHIRMRRLHNRHLHSYGIVWGLEVKSVGSKIIRVTEGIALNQVLEAGEEVSQEIILTKDIERDLSGYKNGESAYIYISYSERREFKDSQGEDVEQEVGKEPYWQERPVIDHSTKKPTNEKKYIILARVDIKDETLDVKFEENGKPLRVYAGFSGNRIETKILDTEKLTLSIENCSFPPFIEGRIFELQNGDEKQNGLHINSPRTNFTGALSINDDLIIEEKDIDGEKELNIDSPQTNFKGSLTITGDLTVKGTTTTVNTKTLEVTDDIITVNKYKPRQKPIEKNGGLEVFRGGTAKNAQIIWDENEDKWKIGLEGSLIDIAYSEKWKKKNWEQLTEALSIADNGNVGIGTTNPIAKLEISGILGDWPNNKSLRIQVNGKSNEFADHIYIVADNKSTTDKYGIAFAGDGHHRGGIYVQNTGGSSSKAGNISIWNRIGTSINLVGGNVGIGTISPTEKLEVMGNIKIHSPDTSMYCLDFTRKDEEGRHIWQFRHMNEKPRKNSLEICEFMVYSDVDYKEGVGGGAPPDPEWIPRFVIKKGGNVGIGTTLPGAKLDVIGNLAVTGSILCSENVGIGTTNPVTKLDVNGEISGLGIVPIGSIIAWHKSFTNTPALPNGWVECNGQVLNDSESPYNGQTIPNLNSVTGYKGGRFLRGNTNSGIMQGATQIYQQTGYAHDLNLRDIDGEENEKRQAYQAGNNCTHDRPWYKTRPVNMSVVWIMRVK